MKDRGEIMKPSLSVKLWSALPTPLDDKLRVDGSAVDRMIKDAVEEGMTGVFLAGTCGEGPWLQDEERIRLIEHAVVAAAGKLEIAAQVTDNSVPRVLDNIARASEAGATLAIMATPSNYMNPTGDRMVALFSDVARNSPLPLGIYDLGKHRPVAIPQDRLQEIYHLPNVQMVKDSSSCPERRAMALAARELRPELQLFNGNEFKFIEYLEAGYDGCVFGGAIAVPAEMRRIVACFQAGEIEEAQGLQDEMVRVLYGIYGGEKIECWLTGLKYHLVRRGLFTSTTSFLGYPLTDSCRAFIDADVALRHRNIEQQTG